MKKVRRFLVWLIVLAAIGFSQQTHAQQQQGDTELQFAGSLLKIDDFTVGNVQTKLGRFVTDRLELGAYPSLSISSSSSFGETETEATFGLGVFGVVSLLADDATTVPYFGGQFFKTDLSNEDDRGSAGINAGLKFFINRYTAFDISGNYLFSLNEGDDSEIMLLQVGLSFLL